MNRLHFAGADGIRGFACLIVLVLHSLAFVFPGSLPYYTGMPKTGVWLFFVLSAFLLTAQLLARSMNRQTLLDYFVGRVLRIYPAYALIVVAAFVLQNIGISTREDLWLALTMQRGYAHLWTIPVEFKFYFALPLIVWSADAIYRRAGIAALSLAVAAFVGLHQIAFPFWRLTQNDTATLPYLPVFLFGVLAAFAHVNGHDGWIRRNGAWIAGGLLVGWIAVSPLARYLALGIAPTDYLVNKAHFFGAAGALLVCAQAVPVGLVGKALKTRFLRTMGERSYSIYLVHIFVIVTLSADWPNNPLAVVGGIVLPIVIGGWMLRTVELPLFALRQRVVPWIQALPGVRRTLAQ